MDIMNKVGQASPPPPKQHWLRRLDSLPIQIGEAKANRQARRLSYKRKLS